MFRYNTPQVKSLLDHFGQYEAREGKELFDYDHVWDIYYLPNENIVEALVAEQVGEDELCANVVIHLDHYKNITKTTCDCWNDRRCSHLYAAFLSLPNTRIEKEIGLRIVSKTEPLPEIDFTFAPKKFNAIPYTTKKDLHKTIRQLRPNDFQSYSYYDEVDFELKSEGSILATYRLNSYLYNQSNNYLAEIKYDDERIHIKCKKCHQSYSSLCSHSYYAMEKLSKLQSFQDAWSGELGYEQLIAQFAQQHKLSPKTVRSSFKIFLAESYGFAKTNSQLLLDHDITEFKNLLKESISPSSVSEESVFGSKAELETRGNALLWQYAASNSYEYAPTILSAKLNKARTKLISNFSREDHAILFDQKKKLFYDGLKDVLDKNQIYPEQMTIDALIKYLTANLVELNACINYSGEKHEIWQGYYDKIKKSALFEITFYSKKLEIFFTLEEQEDDLVAFETVAKLSGRRISLAEIACLHPLFLLDHNNRAFIYNKVQDKEIIFSIAEHKPLLMPKSDVGELAPVLNKLRKEYEVIITPPTLFETVLLYGGKKELYFSDLGQFIIIRPKINFGDNYVQNALTKEFIDNVDPVLLDVQGDDAESFLEELAEMHPIFEQALPHTDFFSISLADFLHDNWFFDFFEKCKRLDIDVFGTDLLSSFKFNKNKPAISAIISSGIDWFGSNVDISFGKLKVPLNSWVEMVKNNQKYIKLSDGTLGLMPEEWVDKLKALYNAGFQEDGEIKVSKYNFSIIDEYFEELSDEAAFEQIKKKKKAFENYTSIKKYRLPRSIKAELREYQMEGYRWLRFLDEYELGGCLADDMGLGKTLQMLCLLAYKKERKACFALVVVPNSLIFNWSNEIEKFCPSLKFLIHHGPNRGVEKIDKKKYDIIITTYGTAASDVKDLREIEFETIILDESQAIKNPNSKRYKAVKLLKAAHRYVMTGTPIENNTFDLFAQINFVNPGLLGNANSFRSKFAIPIDSRGDQDQSELLRKIIHPFLLRRTKEQVAKDLPEKSESIIVCEMGAKQKKYYDSVRNDIRNSLNKSLKEEGLGRAKFQMLEGLLRLRQICNSPQLVDKSAKADSVKIDTLIEHIMSNNTHKALVFSQFVGMLGLIKERLDEMQIKYSYLDGSTKNRQEQVEKFQSDRKCQVFLISIKAGNTGLNLTAADYVYIVDPWWNPAVEAQAIDRTHRIGQVNNVFAYRMVCKDTIEEKILLLQEKKKAVAADIIQTDESILKSLNKDDLLGLFE